MDIGSSNLTAPWLAAMSVEERRFAELHLVEISKKKAFTVGIDRSFLDAEMQITKGMLLESDTFRRGIDSDAAFEFLGTSRNPEDLSFSCEKVTSEYWQDLSRGFISQTRILDKFKEGVRSEIFSIVRAGFEAEFLKPPCILSHLTIFGGTMRRKGDKLFPLMLSHVRKAASAEDLVVHVDNSSVNALRFSYYGGMPLLVPSFIALWKGAGVTSLRRRW